MSELLYMADERYRRIKTQEARRLRERTRAARAAEIALSVAAALLLTLICC